MNLIDLSMRIISGRFRGKGIRAPKNLPVRPTTDMAKESLFNILNNRLFFEDVALLDLFCGIGSISLEFASRGCSDITAVDSHGDTIRFLKKTIDELQIEGINVVRADALSYLRNSYGSYDVVFMDPPYEYPEYEEIVRLILDRGLLKEGGLLIVEHDRRQSFLDHPNFIEHRKYGGVEFSLLASAPFAE